MCRQRKEDYERHNSRVSPKASSCPAKAVQSAKKPNRPSEEQGLDQNGSKNDRNAYHKRNQDWYLMTLRYPCITKRHKPSSSLSFELAVLELHDPRRAPKSGSRERMMCHSSSVDKV